jgi:hypothetical protein
MCEDDGKSIEGLKEKIGEISDLVNGLERNNADLYRRLDGYFDRLRHELKVMVAVGIPIAVTAITLIIHFIAR